MEDFLMVGNFSEDGYETEEPPISAQELLFDLFPLDGQKIEFTLPNGQKFYICAKETVN